MTVEMKVSGLAWGGSQVGLVVDIDVSYFCSCTLILPASALKWIFPPPTPRTPPPTRPIQTRAESERVQVTTEEAHKRAHLHNRKQRRVLSRRLFLDFFFPSPPPHCRRFHFIRLSSSSINYAFMLRFFLSLSLFSKLPHCVVSSQRGPVKVLPCPPSERSSGEFTETKRIVIE